MILARIITKTPIKELYPKDNFPIMEHIEVINEYSGEETVPTIRFGAVSPINGVYLPEWEHNQRLFRQQLEDFLYNLPELLLSRYRFKVLNMYYDGHQTQHALLDFLKLKPDLKAFHAKNKKTIYLQSGHELYSCFYPAYQYMGEQPHELISGIESISRRWVEDWDGSLTASYERMFFESDFCYRIIPLLI